MLQAAFYSISIFRETFVIVVELGASYIRDSVHIKSISTLN